jgi:hypothetical protein
MLATDRFDPEWLDLDGLVDAVRNHCMENGYVDPMFDWRIGAVTENKKVSID